MRNRLHALCPYFAMFPESFVEEHVRAYTHPGDYVFDPFAGRGTTVLQSLLMGRHAGGTDINPVAYCLSAAKAQVPRLTSVLQEIDSLERRYEDRDRQNLVERRRRLPQFFGRAFYYTTLEQLLYLRDILDWRHRRVHRFIAAMVLGTLHGEMDTSMRYLSNQMPRTISSKPAYSLRYWKRRNLWPRKKDVFPRLKDESRFRLSGELPSLPGLVQLTDVREAAKKLPSLRGRISCIITSPPYFDVTDCAEDQWLRLWFLGNDPKPTYGKVSRDDRHEQKEKYWKFLSEAWGGIADLVRRDATLVCRLGGAGMTEPEITSGLAGSLRQAFPKARLILEPKKTDLTKRQTPAFRPGSTGCRFEVDYVFRLGSHAPIR